MPLAHTAYRPSGAGKRIIIMIMIIIIIIIIIMIMIIIIMIMIIMIMIIITDKIYKTHNKKQPAGTRRDERAGDV